MKMLIVFVGEFCSSLPKKNFKLFRQNRIVQKLFNDGVLSKGLNFRLKLLNEFIFCSFFVNAFRYQ